MPKHRYTELSFTTLCLVGIAAVLSPPVANAQDEEYVVIKAGRVITVSGEEYAPGTIVIEDGKISLVGGSKIEYPPSATVIQARGETVMPGMINARSRYGLPRYSRSGVHGDQTAADEVYLSQIEFEHFLEAGFTSVCFIPAGKGIPGRAAVYRTAGPDEKRKITDSSYLHVPVNWAAKGKDTLRKALKKAKGEIEKVEKARKEWDEKQKKAKEEAEKKKKEKPDKPEEKNGENGEGGKGKVAGLRVSEGDDEGGPNGDEGKDKTADKKEQKPEEFKPPKIDPKYQALVDLIEKKEGAQMVVRMQRASDLHHFDEVIKPYEDLNHSFYIATRRATDFQHVVEMLGERKARIVIRPWIHYLPQTTFRYNLMDQLADAGAELTAIPFGDSRQEFLNLRSRLADLTRAGLDREAALKSLTLHPARILGLEKSLGSLEKGKDADVIFLSGDPLDPHSQVNRVMVLGEIVWTADED